MSQSVTKKDSNTIEIEDTQVTKRVMKIAEVDAILASLEEQRVYWQNIKNLIV